MSSDSEDDCYGNIAQKLQKMKNRYQEDKIESTNLLDDSAEADAELDEIVKKSKKSVKKELSSSNSAADIAWSSVSDLPDISLDSTNTLSTRRATRSTAKKRQTEERVAEMLPPTPPKRRKSKAKTAENTPRGPSKGRGKGRGKGRARQAEETPTPSPRGCGRSRPRGWGRRNRRTGTTLDFLSALIMPTFPINTDASIPTYSVGNTDEYTDQSDSQALFSNKKTNSEVVFIDENDSLDDNEELSVKVYWQSSEFFKFTIRRYQKLNQIFDYFAHKEGVSTDKLLLTYNDKILSPEDTPDSIDYNIVKFIDGGIVNQSVAQLVSKDNEKIKDGIKIKFQCQNVKKPFEITIRLDDKLSLAMMKCSENLEKPLDKLRFEFDGDCISGKTTARDLELEGEECIDVKILS